MAMSIIEIWGRGDQGDTAKRLGAEDVIGGKVVVGLAAEAEELWCVRIVGNLIGIESAKREHNVRRIKKKTELSYRILHLQVVGPIIVDTTPPMFVGHVSVHAEDKYLISEWEDEGFVDDEDQSLEYQVGIGKCSKYQFLSFMSLLVREQTHLNCITENVFY